MKRKIILCALFLFGCSYGERANWDSGGDAQRESIQQQQEDVTEGTQNRLPSTTRPRTETSQPF